MRTTFVRKKELLQASLVMPLIFFIMSFSCKPTQAGQAQRDALMFVDVTKKSGLALIKPHSYSAAAADYNNDGYPDLLVCHHGPLSLWKNNGNGTFSDATAIVPKIPADKHGVSFIDLNKDGFVDISIAVGADRGRGQGGNLFLLNRNGRDFVRAASPAPSIEYSQGRGRSIAPVDINRDGNIDLLLMNYVAKKNDPPHRLAISKIGDQKNTEWSDYPLGEQLSISQAFGCSVVSLDNTDNLYFLLTGPGRDAGKIFQLQQGVFTDVTDELGINREGCMSVTPIDYDNDGDFDLFYGRGLPPPSSSVGISDGMLKFIINNKSKTASGFSSPAKAGKIKIDIRFEQKIGAQNLHLGRSKQPFDVSTPVQIDLADLILQGRPEIDQTSDSGGFLWRDIHTGRLHYIFLGTDTLQETEGEIQPVGFTFTDIEKINVPTQTFPPYKNSLYKNEHSRFIDVANKAGIFGSGQVFTSLAADFNNDGFQDIYALNIGQSFEALNPPNNLFLNNGEGTFTDVGPQSGAAGPKTGIGSGAIVFDYDGDGKLDILLHNGNTIFPQKDGPTILLKNSSKIKNKSMQITLKGAHETQGWGAQIRAKLGDNNTLLQQKYALNGYLSASDLPIHIGLGGKKEIEKLQINWVSGKQQDISHITKAKLTISEP